MNVNFVLSGIRHGSVHCVLQVGYIDNKKIKGTVDLDRLSSSDIKHVEVITEPGAEYDATYQAVIRIKTTRKKGEGLGLTYRQVYQRNHQNNHREVLDLNYRYRGLDIFSNLYEGLPSC